MEGRRKKGRDGKCGKEGKRVSEEVHNQLSPVFLAPGSWQPGYQQW